MGSTNPKVTLKEIIPEPCGFFAGLVINAPLDGASGAFLKLSTLFFEW
jgi:hypothetical protein